MNIPISGITVNATLIVQMLNFWITYAILRYFLFGPVYHGLVQEKREGEHLKQQIAFVELELVDYQEHLSQVWAESRASCDKLRPQLNHNAVSCSFLLLRQEELSVQVVDKMQADIAVSLVNMIGRIDD